MLLQNVRQCGCGVHGFWYEAMNPLVPATSVSDATLAAHMGVFGPIKHLHATPVIAAEEWNRRYPTMPYSPKWWARKAHQYANNS